MIITTARTSLLVSLLVVGCKATPASDPTPAAKPVEAAATHDTLPGACVALPKAADPDREVIRDFDLDGDGTKDALIPPSADACNKYDCNYDVYLVRGACAHHVGAINLGLEHELTIATTKTHGLPDLATAVYGDTYKYAFDGKAYVVVGGTNTPKKTR